MLRIRAARDDLSLSADNLRRAIAARANWLCVVKFDHLPIIDIRAESLFGCINVSRERIARKLDSISQALSQVFHKRNRRRQVTLTDAICWNKLCIGVYRDEGLFIIDASGVVFRSNLLLLLSDLAPNLVKPNALAVETAHRFIRQLGAASPDFDRLAHDSIAMCAGYPLNGADGVALDKGGNDLSAAVQRKAAHWRLPLNASRRPLFYSML